ncbi:hypothetical protein HJC23_003535 [Cyclotella cryptica]|uniref:Transmembrane protein n=1 Tax=Cyclotella cryptica TaxID=29204 RepID=A0ABD3P172_9STRA|eukprot:CCRYP_018578-RA/>CCRYP_018578-RA protein AED:0.00 eAED:0.00 QI:88/-1/1/1/-1/1/1/488/201
MTPIGNLLLLVLAVFKLSATSAFQTSISWLSTHPVAIKHKISTNGSFLSSRSLINLSQSSSDESESYEEGVVQNQESAYDPPPAQPRRQTLDPLVASLTRIDDPIPSNTPTTNVPLIGEIPADGNLALFVPAAAIGVLGFIFSIVVAFNAKDAIVQELSQVELPKMEYTPTVVEEGVCRGLCSSQESDLEGLRGFMQNLAK